MNQRQIAKVLRESVFKPGQPGPLKAIVDSGNNSYFVQRAIEFLKLSLESPTTAQQYSYITRAISLLAVAKVNLAPHIEPFKPKIIVKTKEN